MAGHRHAKSSGLEIASVSGSQARIALREFVFQVFLEHLAKTNGGFPYINKVSSGERST